MEEVIRAELDRIRDEDTRQNHRLEQLEESVKEVQNISRSVEKLAINMEHMLEEMKNQGNRIDKLESKPTDRIEKFVTAILSAIAGAVGLAIVNSIVHFM